MYGAILGDMIGAPYEFDRGNKTKDFPLFSRRSEFTDDSVMTIAVAEALMNTLGRSDEEIKNALVASMQKWGHMYPDAGYGGRFYHWLRARHPEPYGSYGNGSAMRVSSAGWLFETLEETRRMARLTAEVTHNHPEGIKGAEATASAIFMARNGSSKDEIRSYIIREFDDDWDIGSVQRTLTVTGLAGSDIPAVTDSASFVFPCSDTNALDLVLTGYHRLAGSDQTIIADLLLTNQGEETLKNIRLSITDNNDNSVSPDHFFGISSEISYSLEPHQSIAFGAEIHPSGEELAHMKVIRRISAVDADASVADTVRLQVDLHTDLVEKALLHLEGELTGPASLQLHEMFGADLNAWNGGSVTLEDIYIDCTIQSPSGKVLLMKSYGTSGSSYAPGKRLQISPAFTITEEMVTAALADLPLKNNQPDTLTFLFSSRGIWRDGTSITPVISTPVIFTVNIKNDSMISIREDTSVPAQNPGAGEVLNIPLIIQNVGDDNLFSLRLDVSQSVDGTIVFEDSLIDDPSVILSPGMEYPYIYSYPVTKEDVERGGISLSFLVRSASRIIDSPIQDICTYSKTLA